VLLAVVFELSVFFLKV